MGVAMGSCISGCVECFTDLHDRYIDLKWRDVCEEDFDDMVDASKSVPAPKTNIHVAVVDKSEEDIRRILRENEAAKSCENSSGETPLHQACRLGYTHIVHALLECGCLASVKSRVGTGLHCVIKAAQTGYTSNDNMVHLVRLLVSAGCKVNDVDCGQKTPLFCAVEQGNLEAVKTLVELGADVNVSESNRFTPLYMGVIRGDINIVRFLMKCPSIDINASDTTGRTPLISSLISITNNFRYDRMPNDIYNMNTISDNQLTQHRFNRIAIVEALLAAGADSTVLDNHDRTALVIAFTILELDCISRTQGPLTFHPSNHHQNSQNSQAGLLSESVYVPLVRLLILSGARFPQGWQKTYKGPAWLTELYQESLKACQHNIIQRPSKLVHLCRVSIRGHMADTGHLGHIHLLPVPPKLRDYLLVNYL